MSNNQVVFSELLGKTIIKIDGAKTDSEIVSLVTDDGTTYRMEHFQDCCEEVRVVDVVGDIEDILNSPITLAEESTSECNPEGAITPNHSDESFTWTFYKLATVKGYVTIRWYGSSNGYYGEEVDFVKSDDAEDSNV